MRLSIRALPCGLLLSAVTALALALVANAAPTDHASEQVELLRHRAPAQRPTLLLVGVAHFANPGRDIHDAEIPDILTPKRQQQIQAVAGRLEHFHPTHVAVEWPIDKQHKLNERYARYLKGDYKLSSNEVDQLGLRIAAALHLPRVDAVDFFRDHPGKRADYDFEAYAKKHGEEKLLQAVESHKAVMTPDWLAHHSVLQWLEYLNQPTTQSTSNRAYFDFTLIGGGPGKPYVGANWVGAWYMRNLKIFSNLVRIADSPTDRILVIYGNGHAFLLKQFARQSGAFKVADAEKYLKGNTGK